MRQPQSAIRRAGHLLTALAALGIGVGACGGRNQPEDQPAADPLAPTELTVNNNHWLDVVVFVFHDGELTRVGTVTATSSASFFLPPWMLGQTRSIRLLGDPVGSNGWIRTETIHIQPGQFIEWRLESQLSRSSVAVY
jgi:hypothetical protein